MDLLNNGSIRLYNNDSLSLYNSWDTPTVIISDGPYGVKGYPGDLATADELGEWYTPHVIEWARYSTPQTTLWFWNTELGWANVHPILKKYGWEYKACCVWNKGMSHVAGNINTKTISKLPVVSEICAQYVRKAEFCVEGITYNMKEWLRYEWARTGLPFSKANDACGVKDAATRKYFTRCHLWYMPPADAFEKIVSYANLYGRPEGRPYFSIDGNHSIARDEWQAYRAKFYCPMGLTNVWSESQLNGKERLKNGTKAAHKNQKPLKLIETTIKISSDEDDVVWDPFGGLFTTAIACYRQHRQCYSAEVRPDMYKQAFAYVLSILNQTEQLSIKSGILA